MLNTYLQNKIQVEEQLHTWTINLMDQAFMPLLGV